MFIYRLVDELQKRRIAFAVAGGFAVALHGAVRGTVDVDIVVKLTKKDFQRIEEALKALGLAPRLPITASEVFEFREEYMQRRNLLAWSFSNPANPSEIVDVVITRDLARMKTVKVRAGGREIPVLGLADLIGMKRESGRPQDIEDIRALERFLP